MRTIDTTRAAPIFTADRVAAAWDNAATRTRVATLGAVAVAAILGSVVPAEATVRWAVAMCGVLLATAALVDLHEHKLPNTLLATAALVTFAAAVCTLDKSVVIGSVSGMAMAGGLMLLVRITRGGVGMGDVKMAGVVGLSVGTVDPAAAPLAVAAAATAGACWGFATRRARLAFGPALWLGWATVLAALGSGVLR